jgi:hypothetical protein
LDSRGDAPDEPWFDKDGCETQIVEHVRFALRQWVDSFTIAEIYEFEEEVIDRALALDKFKKEVEAVLCSDGKLYRWIGGEKT